MRTSSIEGCQINHNSYKFSPKNFNDLNLTDKSLLSLVGKSYMMSIDEENFIKNLASKYDELG